MRIVMMGTGTFALPTLQALLKSPHQVVGLATQPDRPVGQERGSTRQTGPSMKDVALQAGIAVMQPESINTPQAMEQLRSLQADMLVVAAYGQILSRDVLATTPNGGINVHASLLPKYRGAAPIAWAIYHGETHTGVTIIHMSPQLDAGAMLAQETVEIGAEETAGELEARLAPLGAAMALRVLDDIAAKRQRGIQQDKTFVTKAPKLTKEHGIIDWTRHGRDICNHIRAMQPWPTAYSYYYRDNEDPIRIIICKAKWHEAGGSVPGQVLPTEAGRLIVASGSETMVEVTELQPAGKRRMSAADFLRGHPARMGDRMGPTPS